MRVALQPSPPAAAMSADELAEYDNTQRDVNHVHTVWRDPENDFGAGHFARAASPPAVPAQLTSRVQP